MTDTQTETEIRTLIKTETETASDRHTDRNRNQDHDQDRDRQRQRVTDTQTETEIKTLITKAPAPINQDNVSLAPSNPARESQQRKTGGGKQPTKTIGKYTHEMINDMPYRTRSLELTCNLRVATRQGGNEEFTLRAWNGRE